MSEIKNLSLAEKNAIIDKFVNSLSQTNEVINEGWSKTIHSLGHIKNTLSLMYADNTLVEISDEISDWEISLDNRLIELDLEGLINVMAEFSLWFNNL